MKITACLLAFVVAQDQQGDDAAAAPAAPASDGYGAAATESYGAQETAYGAPSYEAAASPSYAVEKRCCVRRCPEHSPYFSLSSCGCMAGITHTGYATQESYAQENQPSYGAQSTEQSAGYRLLSAPANTVDTRMNRATSSGRICLWVAFAILFLSGWYFMWCAKDFREAARGNFDGVSSETTSQSDARAYGFLSGPSFGAGAICLIAALAYLTMAVGGGFYVRCWDGREFFYARYIDWVITTPLLLHGLAHFSNMPDDSFAWVFFTDVLMIISGLVASTVEGNERWAFFAFAMLMFIPVLQSICAIKDTAINVNFDYGIFFDHYGNLLNLTFITWICYPIIWILAEGTNTLSANGEIFAYTILDVLAKAALGFIIVNAEPCIKGSEIAAAGHVAGAALLAGKLQKAGHTTVGSQN